MNIITVGQVVKTLNPRAAEVYKYLRECTAECFSPSYRDISRALELSTTSVYYHICQLVAAGLVDKRGIGTATRLHLTGSSGQIDDGAEVRFVTDTEVGCGNGRKI